MTSPRPLDSMAARVFALLMVGIVIAAALAFSVSDLQRRAGEQRDREQRFVDRIADADAFLAAGPPASRFDRLGAGPEAPVRR